MEMLPSLEKGRGSDAHSFNCPPSCGVCVSCSLPAALVKSLSIQYCTAVMWLVSSAAPRTLKNTPCPCFRGDKSTLFAKKSLCSSLSSQLLGYGTDKPNLQQTR